MSQYKNLNSPNVVDAVSFFLVPVEAPSSFLKDLKDKNLKAIDRKALDSPKLSIHIDDASNFNCTPVTISFGPNKTKAYLIPRIAWVEDCPWVVLIIQAELCRNQERLMPFDDLLAFNVGFRKFQAIEEQPQDSFFGVHAQNFKVTSFDPALPDTKSDSPPSTIYEQYAKKLFGKEYTFLPHLKKAVLLSYAKFDQNLNNEDLYRLGTVAYPTEPVSLEWVKNFEKNRFDRWVDAGLRCFTFSYSLVFALGPSVMDREDEKIKNNFCTEYISMGASIAIQRAWLQQIPEKVLSAAGLKEIRECHKEMVAMNTRFGVRWTPEGTQRMQIEQMWQRSTGIDDRLMETKQLLDQKIELCEADAAERLNTAIFILQIILGAFAVAQIGMALNKDNVMGCFSGLVLAAGIFWLFYLFYRKKQK